MCSASIEPRWEGDTAPSSEGAYVKRILRHDDVTELAERLAKMAIKDRAALPGVSRLRAPQPALVREAVG